MILSDSFAASSTYPQEFADQFSSLPINDRLVRDTLNPDKSTRGTFDSLKDSIIRLILILQRLVALLIRIQLCVSRCSQSSPLHGRKQIDSLLKRYGILAPTTLPGAELPAGNIRPVNVHYYVQAYFVVNGENASLLLAYVSWLYPW